MEFETKQKNQKWSLVVENFDVDDNVKTDINVQSKRKLSTKEDDWELPAKRRSQKLKLHHNPSMSSIYDKSDYSSDGFDDGDILQVVPDWNIKITEDSRDHLSHDSNDGLSSNDSEVQIVTIDEVLQFDNLESLSEFDVRKLFQTESKKLDLKNDKQDIALDVLLALTNSSPVVFYDVDEKKSRKETEHAEQYIPLPECNDCWEVENCKDQWQDDCQVEDFKFARCFKCKQKVYIMRDCPRHGTKNVVTSESDT